MLSLKMQKESHEPKDVSSFEKLEKLTTDSFLKPPEEHCLADTLLLAQTNHPQNTRIINLCCFRVSCL